MLIFTIKLYEGKDDFTPSETMQEDLYRAERFLKSFKNDSAIAITNRLLASFPEEKHLNSYFGLRVKLAEAMAFEQKQLEDYATSRLHKIVDHSKNKKETADVYVKACLLLALIHEKADLSEHSLKYLNEAKSSIDNFGLDSLYPYYAVRMASWKRFYESRESAIPYAQEVLEKSPKFSLKLEEAVGHLLMQSLLSTVNPEASLQHSLKALSIYKELEELPGQFSMYTSASRAYFKMEIYDKALLYNDSSIVLASKSSAYGYDLDEQLSYPYILRGDIYKKTGMADSAWFYMTEGNRIEKSYLESNNAGKISEIEVLNNAEKKALKYEADLKQRNILLIVIGIALLLTLSLIYIVYRNYRRQKKTGIVLARQNKLINEQAEHLKYLDIAKSMFFANASHELRTPLTLMSGPVETLLKEKSLSEKQERLLEIINQGSKDLSKLINQILDLEKLDADIMGVYPTPVHAASFFKLLFAQFESLAESKGIYFTSNVDINREVSLLLDKEKCRQIVYNLLSNAFKFTLPGGTVSGKVIWRDQLLKIEVIDTGTGINEEDIPYVFNRYFQVARPKTTAKGGLGIGLGICKEYVKLLGGSISVKSRIGVGSTFYVEFPSQSTNAHVEEEKSEEELYRTGISKQYEKADPSKPTILVVEDNDELKEYLKQILVPDYNVILAEHGEAALKKANKQIDLIISDLMMPVMDGYQLLERLKATKSTAGIPVVMLTARAEKDSRLKALRIGVDDYMLKPFSEDELRARIENLLKNYKNRKEAIAEPDEEPDQISENDREWMAKFDRYVQEIYLNKNLNIPDIAIGLAMSESTLLRKVKKISGLSPLQYIQEVRLRHAYELVTKNNNTYTVQQIAILTGYKDARSFSRAFKNRFGKAPSELISG